MSPEQAARILAVEIGASKDEIRLARRRLARATHPDVGGTDHDMALVNEAYRVLLSARGSESIGIQHDAGPQHDALRVHDIDRPSFVIDRLPAEAFEYLVLAARVLGDVADEDPPYLLEVMLEDPPLTWCRLEIVPDAGGSTVSIESEGRISASQLCDKWVRTINEISRHDPL